MNSPTRKTPTLWSQVVSTHVHRWGLTCPPNQGAPAGDAHEADAEHEDDTGVLGSKVPIALHEMRELAGDDLAVDGGHCVGRRLRGAEIKGEIWSCAGLRILATRIGQNGGCVLRAEDVHWPEALISIAVAARTFGLAGRCLQFGRLCPRVN